MLQSATKNIIKNVEYKERVEILDYISYVRKNKNLE